MGDRIFRGDREHTLELALREFEAARAHVELRVLADDRAHAEAEVLGALQRVRSRGRLGVARLEELARRVDPLLELRVAAEEERLEAAAVLRLRL